jgi:hypothetical protein
MPGVVKGSKQVRMTVVPFRPWLRGIASGAALLMIFFASLAGFRAGFQRGSEDLAELKQVHQNALLEHAQMTEALVDVRSQLSVLSRTRLVDQQVNEQAQASISELRSQVAALERDVALYRQVVAMEGAGAELAFQEWQLAATGVPGIFRYRLLISQFGGSGMTVNTRLYMQLEGEGESGAQLIAFGDLSEQFDGAAMSIDFRYLHALEGDIVIPQGFQPQMVHAQLSAEQSAYKPLTESFDWRPLGEI